MGYKMKGFSGFKSPLKSGHYKREPKMGDTKEEHRKLMRERRERKKAERIRLKKLRKTKPTNPKSEKERYLDYLRHNIIPYPKNIA
jgi:hypothetical protein